MLLLSQRRPRLLGLLLLLNCLILSLSNRNLLLDGAHNSLGINGILLSVRQRITFHGSVVESPILTQPLVFISSILSSTSWSISECRDILPYLRALSRFADLFLDLLILHFSIWHYLAPIKELLISSKLRVFWYRILSLKNLIHLPRCQHIGCFVWLVMHAVVHIWKQAALILNLLLLHLARSFVLCANSSFWVIPGKLVVDGDVQLLITGCSGVVVDRSVAGGSVLVVRVLVGGHVLDKLTVVDRNHHVAAVVEVLVSAHARITADATDALSVMMINILSLIRRYQDILLLHHLIIHLFHFAVMTYALENVLFHYLAHLVIGTTTSSSIVHLIWICGVLPLCVLSLVSHFLPLITYYLSVTKRKLVSLNRWVFSNGLHFLCSLI